MFEGPAGWLKLRAWVLNSRKPHDLCAFLNFLSGAPFPSFHPDAPLLCFMQQNSSQTKGNFFEKAWGGAMKKILE
jgi:hypothetical protein